MYFFFSLIYWLSKPTWNLPLIFPPFNHLPPLPLCLFYSFPSVLILVSFDSLPFLGSCFHFCCFLDWVHFASCVKSFPKSWLSYFFQYFLSPFPFHKFFLSTFLPVWHSKTSASHPHLHSYRHTFPPRGTPLSNAYMITIRISPLHKFTHTFHLV